MFVSPDVQLPDAIRNKLNEFAEANPIEGDHPLPIRVEYGRFQVFTPGPWSAEQAEACGVSADIAQAHGLTLVNWGAASAQYGREWHNLPGVFYMDNAERALEIRDIVVPNNDQPRQAMPYHIGDEAAPDVGEIGERTVWFFLNLTYLPDPDILDIDTVVLEPARRSIDPAFVDEFAREREERSAQAYSNLMLASPERRLRTQREQIDQWETELRGYEERIRTVRQRLDPAARELDAMMATFADQDGERFKEDWRRIAGHPMIVPGTLQMSGNVITYDTVMIQIRDQNTDSDIPLGRMRISIDTDSGSVTINNLNNRRRDRDHPHVSNGVPCFGGYQAEVLNYINQRQFAALVEFLFGYLQSYNPADDWGRFFAYWRDQPELVSP